MPATTPIALRRLANQYLVSPKRRSAPEVVAALGAVQAQDYGSAKWAIALRTVGLTDDVVERSLSDGAIVRTHVMRPTWHFVAPADLRWLLALTAPRVHAANAYRYRELEIDREVFRRSHAAIARALRDGAQLTRTELGQVLERSGIDVSMPQRLPYLLVGAELDGLICSGARRGKQFTYALLEERVPPQEPMERDAALRELIVRYFATRGPATPQDFSWWSGLTVADARRGLDVAGAELEQTTLEGRSYWSAAALPRRRLASPAAHLLPNFDEYFIGYRDRSAILQAAGRSKMERGDALSAHVIVLDGQVVGGWKRRISSRTVSMELTPVVRLTRDQRRTIESAAERYGAFLELPVDVAWMARGGSTGRRGIARNS